MRKARGRDAIASGLMLAGVVLAWCPCTYALDPALDVSQYVHTSWKIRDGFARGTIQAIAQTQDGYLWLGTDFGLLRFDGVRSVRWSPPADQDLPSTAILRLLAARDGTLWIGTSKGLVSWKDGRLTAYTELAGQFITALLEDREGTVWSAALGVPTGKLCAIQKGRVECEGDDGRLGRGVFDLYEDSRGNLWAGVNAGLWLWKPRPPRFYGLPAKTTVNALLEEDDGALLVGGRGGILRLIDGKTDANSLRGTGPELNARTMLRDRDGSLWIGTVTQGLVHVHAGRTDVFTQVDGLSGNAVTAFLEDREGNLWTATAEGLDRFRDPAVATFSEKQGVLGRAAVTSVLAVTDGSVWLRSEGGLNRWTGGRMTTPRTGSGPPDGKLDGQLPNSLFQDRHGRIWISTLRGVGSLENDRFTVLKDLPGGFVRSFADDTAGNLWIVNQDLGLLGLHPGGEVQRIPWAMLGHEDFATALIADPRRGGLWVGFFRGGIVYVTDGRVRASYGAGDGLGDGYVASLRFDPDQTLWAATEGGLSRVKDGRVATLNTGNGLPCDEVHWSMEDDARSLWLYTACGLVHIARPELDAWVAAVDKDRAGKNKDTKPTIHATVFDASDGVMSHPGAGGFGPLVARSPDGKLWFLPWHGVSVVDPRRLPFNKLPPPVNVEQVIADRKVYGASAGGAGALHLPALIRDLEIDYTALSLVAPEKVRFRYKLEGRDRDWQDAGTRRQALNANLPPGDYRFRVIACNNSGVWNEEGAALGFNVAPAWYQTRLFRALCAIGAVTVPWALYRLRLRQIEVAIGARFDERLAERTRLARDLHDTLLQTIQGCKMVAHNALDRSSDAVRMRDAMQRLDAWLARAVQEGRAALNSLRPSATEEDDLFEALKRATKGEVIPSSMAATCSVSGDPTEMHPIVRDEVYRIGYEAILNACLHSRASRLSVELEYAHDLTLRVSDDGVGVDPVLVDKGKSGHFGLRGMRERAARLDGKLAFTSAAGSGTVVSLVVPGGIAFPKRRPTGFARIRGLLELRDRTRTLSTAQLLRSGPLEMRSAPERTKESKDQG
jgi:signal transduction histidine kinase/ligand-binding sensor domain-containing protein